MKSKLILLIAKLFKMLKSFYTISLLIGCFFIMAGVVIVCIGHYSENNSLIIHQLLIKQYSNVGTSIFCTGLTIIIIDGIMRHHSDKQELNFLKLFMASQNNMLIAEVIRILRVKGYFEDGSLKNSILINANLSGSNLENIDLRGSNLNYTKFIDCNLYSSKISHSTLENVDLTGANLVNADLSYSSFCNSKLERCLLDGANLTGCNLFGANIKGVRLEHAIFDSETIMPNGQKWIQGQDLTLFQ